MVPDLTNERAVISSKLVPVRFKKTKVVEIWIARSVTYGIVVLSTGGVKVRATPVANAFKYISPLYPCIKYVSVVIAGKV